MGDTTLSSQEVLNRLLGTRYDTELTRQDVLNRIFGSRYDTELSRQHVLNRIYGSRYDTELSSQDVLNRLYGSRYDTELSSQAVLNRMWEQGTLAGALGLVPWSDATAYAPGDMVSLDGALWACVLANTALMPMSPDYREAMVGTVPYSYWRLGEADPSTEPAADVMGANAGTYIGSPASVAGLLAGDSDTAMTSAPGKYMVRTSPDLDLSGTSPFSLAIWVDHTPDVSWRSVIAFSTVDNYGVDIVSQGTLLFFRRKNAVGQDLASAPPLTAATYSLVGTYDGATLRFYVDGVASGDTPASSRVLPALEGFSVGSSFNGTLDEPAIWNRAVTPAEIAGLHAVGTGTVVWERRSR